MASATTIRERPLSLKDFEVRAVLDGTKTQKRFVVKPQPDPVGPNSGLPIREIVPSLLVNHGDLFDVRYDGDNPKVIRCPYEVGQVLWVRETFDWVAGKVVTVQRGETRSERLEHIRYCADGGNPVSCRWTPSIHMPRWASRLTLRITDVRVGRLQAISEADAIAEGFDKDTCGRVLRQAAGKARQEFGRWIELPDGSEPEGYWCLGCVEKEARKRKGRVCGWNDCFDADHAPRCEKCGVMLYHSLTKYGIETELDLTDEDRIRVEYTPKDGDSALCLAELAEGMGDWSDEFAGRLAQIGFGTLWERLNGNGPWAANPWVWAVGFERIN